MKELALSRYEIRGVLGRGGTGVVYEAYDSQDGTIVALKTIGSPNAENLFRLKHEFRSLADVHHPNLVRYGELSCDRGQWFFTMELVRGKNLIEYVRTLGGGVGHHDVTRSESRIASRLDQSALGADRSTPEGVLRARSTQEAGTFDEAKLRSAHAQLASALLAVHAAGHIHRDVKPSNVLVTNDGRVVLLDFGLVTALAPRTHDLDDVVGTPAYMAPEQAEAGRVGPEADWYGVGVMLFVALTGSLPFDGATAAVLTAKTTREAPAPHDRVPGLPPDLDALCSALLRRSPAERPRGDEIAARLGLPVGDPFPSSTHRSADASVPFVGRVAEVGALEAALREVSSGAGGRTLIVEGEPGIGKSSLVQRFLAGLPPEVLVLTGRCYEQETVPFKGIDGIVDALSEHLMALPDQEVRALVQGGVRYLATIFPVLHRVPAIQRAVSPVREVADPSALREQAFSELELLLGALAAERTLVLVVDDLQWADRDSLELLARVLGGAGDSASGGERCLFVATMRTGTGTGGGAAWATFEEAGPPGARLGTREWMHAATRIHLSALSPAESSALVDAYSSMRGATRESKSALMEEAQGHPLFLAELIRGARSGAPSPLHAHAHLEDVLRGRVSARDEIDRRLMEMVAVAGAPVPYDVVARAAGIDVSECQARLGSLRAAQLIRVGRRGSERLIEPYHDRIREAILARLTDAAEKHLRLGRALLDGAPPEALPARVFAIVAHLSAARELLVDDAERRRAAELNLLASRQAQLATAYGSARDYARTGIRLLGESWTEAYEVTRDLHVACMVAESFAGDARAAEECFQTARANLSSPLDKTSLYVAFIGLLTSRGQLAESVRLGRERLRELGAPVPTTVSKLSVLKQYLACRLLQGRRSTRDLLHLPKLDDPIREGVIDLVVALAPAAFFLDTNLLAWLELEGVAISLRYGVSDVSSYSFAVYGTVLTAVFDKHDEGEAFGRLALALNERFQNRKLAARLHFLYGGWHSSWVRPFKDGMEFLRTSYELATKHGDTAYETYAASTRSLVAFSESADLASLQATSEWARDVGVRRRDADMAGFAEVFARYAAALRTGSPFGDASFRATLTDAKTPSSVYYYLYCDAELAYLAGDPARALPLLDEAWKRTQIVFGLPTFVDLTFLDALVAAALHDGAARGERGRLRRRVAKRVAKLRGWARSCAANFEPHYLIASAELARIRGDARQAGTLFEHAVTAARAHGSVKREAFALKLAAGLAQSEGDLARAEALRREAEGAHGRWIAANVVASRLTP